MPCTPLIKLDAVVKPQDEDSSYKKKGSKAKVKQEVVTIIKVKVQVPAATSMEHLPAAYTFFLV